MKKAFTGIGLVFHIAYFAFTILSYGDWPATEGIGTGFAFMVYSMIAVIPCLASYLIAAVYALAKEGGRFHLIILLAVFVSILLSYYCIGRDITAVIIWNSFFVLVFILESISLFRKKNIVSAGHEEPKLP